MIVSSVEHLPDGHVCKWKSARRGISQVKLGGKVDKSFNVIIERDEDGFYVATVPSLRGCHTQAKSLDKLMERVKEAIQLCLEVENEISQNEFIGVQRLAVSV